MLLSSALSPLYIAFILTLFKAANSSPGFNATEQHSGLPRSLLPSPSSHHCPLRIAYVHSDFVKWPSHRVSVGTWKTSLQHHAQIDTNPGDLSSYDALLVMARDSNLTVAWLENVRKLHPKIIIGATKAFALDADFLPRVDFGVVDNDYVGELFLQNGISYARLPTIELLDNSRQASPFLQRFTKERPAILCYQGNKMHLDAMVPEIFPAINKVFEKVPLKVRIITTFATDTFTYNYKKMGLLFPYETHWYDHTTVHNLLADCDLGLVPQSDDSGIELRKPDESMVTNLRHAGWLKAAYSKDWFGDGMILYKRSANSGRAYTFLRFGVPVITDAVPHSIEKIRGFGTGYVAERRAAWRPYIEYFLTHPEERQLLSRRARKFYSDFLTTESMGLSFVEYLFETFQNRLQPEVVKRCREYVSDKVRQGFVFERLRVPSQPA